MISEGGNSRGDYRNDRVEAEKGGLTKNASRKPGIHSDIIVLYNSAGPWITDFYTKL